MDLPEKLDSISFDTLLATQRPFENPGGSFDLTDSGEAELFDFRTGPAPAAARSGGVVVGQVSDLPIFPGGAGGGLWHRFHGFGRSPRLQIRPDIGARLRQRGRGTNPIFFSFVLDSY